METARRFDRALRGDLEYSGLNVNGDDKAGFLDKVEGGAVSDPTALAPGVVITETIAVGAVRLAPVSNSVAISVAGLNAVGGNVNAAGATTVVSTTFDVDVAGDITLRFGASFGFSNREDIELALLLDYAGTHSMQAIRDVSTSDVARFRLIEQPDPGGGPASASIVSTVSLAAGSHTALVLAMARADSAEAIIPAGSASIEVFVR